MAVPQTAPAFSPQQDGALAASAVFLKRSISAVYGEHTRLLSPHVLGWDKDGELRLLCFQYGGTSSKPLYAEGSSNWRCLRLSKLRSVRLLDEPWRSGGKHSRLQSCIQEIIFDAEDPEGARQTKRRSAL